MNTRSWLRVATIAAIAVAPAMVAAQQAPFSTGVDNSGNPLPYNTLDPHYTLQAYSTGNYTGTGSMTATTPGTNDGVYTEVPNGAWTGSGPNANWVWTPLDNGGVYFNGDFRTTFDLTGYDPTTAKLKGNWSVDNAGLDIFINGHSTGITAGGFGGLTPFTINQYFVSGTNTLDFIAQNQGGPGGLLVRDLQLTANQATFTTTPEPSSMALLGTGLVGLVPMLRRRKKA